jgi:hypothetical protein
VTAGLIYQKMPRIMEDVGAIPKGHKNTAQNYRFRSIEDALNVIQPILIKHGVAVAFRSENYKTEAITEKKSPTADRTIYRASLTMHVTFYAEDGSSMESVSAGEGLDFGGDKATNKAQSSAFKYAMFLGLCIPVADLDDSDRDAAAKLTADQPAESNGKPCSGMQIGVITGLVLKLGIQPADFDVALAKRGATTIRDLSAVQADELISGLRSKEAALAPPVVLNTTPAPNDPVAPPTSNPGGAVYHAPAHSGDKTSQYLAEKCDPDRKARIVELAQRLGMDAVDMKAIIVKRGRQTLADLTVSEAMEIIGKMELAAVKKDAEAVLSKDPPFDVPPTK